MRISYKFAPICVLALSVLSLSKPIHAQNAPATRTTAVRAGRILDFKTGSVVINAVILIENGRITSAGSGISVPAGAEVIDIGDAMVLPGLIDCHTHLLENFSGAIGGDDENMVLTVTNQSTATRALLGAAMGREDLEAGITTVRDLGNSGWNGDVALRHAIRSGWAVGQRIFASTRAPSPAGGQFGTATAETQKIVE